MDAEAMKTLFSAIVDGLYSVVILWLLIREQNSHAETREQYRADLRDFAMRSQIKPTPPLPATPPDQQKGV